MLARRQDVSVITANPKTAGVARWNFLALWGVKAAQGDTACQDFVTKVGRTAAGARSGPSFQTLPGMCSLEGCHSRWPGTRCRHVLWSAAVHLKGMLTTGSCFACSPA